MLLWTDSYLGDTSHLTTVEHGAYLLILMSMWRAGGTLPNDETRLARTARLGLDKWRKIAPTIMAFLSVDHDLVTQKRLKLELEIATGKREKLEQAGRLGGRARALKRLSSAPSDVIIDDQAMPVAEAKHEASLPITNNQLPVIDKNPPLSTPQESGGGEDFGFDRFWDLFPKDGLPSKPKAADAWLELTLAERVQAIAAIPAHRAAKPTTHPISPERWLREQRFSAYGSKPTGPSKVTVERMSPQGDAWEQYAKATAGKGLPWPNGRWQCDTEWPPPIVVKVDATA